AVSELIACKEARFTMASSFTCHPPSPFYKLLEIERHTLQGPYPKPKGRSKRGTPSRPKHHTRLLYSTSGPVLRVCQKVWRAKLLLVVRGTCSMRGSQPVQQTPRPLSIVLDTWECSALCQDACPGPAGPPVCGRHGGRA